VNSKDGYEVRTGFSLIHEGIIKRMIIQYVLQNSSFQNVYVY